jgi:CRP-like cAMP-binding protein
MAGIRGLDSWLDVLPASVRGAVDRQLRPLSVADGDAVYSIGDPGRECYFIERGRVRILDYSTGGKELQLMNLRAGASFGETSLIDGLPRSDNAYAVGETALLVLERGPFERLSARHREIAEGLNLHLSYRLRLASAAARDASILTLRDRLPRLLTRLAYSHGRREKSGAILIEDVSHSDVANMLGVTRQTVSRELKKLERTGLVAIRYRQIVVFDPSTLAGRFESLIGEESLLTMKS